MADRDKRLRYYNGQFLQEQDFSSEQEYHLDRLRRHSRQLHTPGIAEGLTVTAVIGASSAVVSPGTALDSDGRQIVLTDSRTVSFGTITSQNVLVMISYREQTSDPATVGDQGDTRWWERPEVTVVAESAVPAGDNRIRLARLSLNSTGAVSAHDTTIRALAGVKLGTETSVERVRLSRQDVDQTQWPVLSSGAANQADVKGNLSVTGNILVTGTVDGRDVSTDGTKLDQHVARTDNPHGTTAAQVGAITGVGGVLNPGGQVNLLAGNNVAITSDNSANKRITISSATINGIANPGGNIGFVGQGGILITPDNTNKVINFNTDLAQASTYLRRYVSNVYFTETDATGATRAVNVGFRPKLISIEGRTWAMLSGDIYFGGAVGGCCSCADDGGTYGICHGPAVRRMAHVPYVAFFNEMYGGNILGWAYYHDYSFSPGIHVRLAIYIDNVTATGFTARWERTTDWPNGTPKYFGMQLGFSVLG